MIHSNRPSAADFVFEIGDEAYGRALAAVIWHVPLGSEFGGLLLPF
jgi:hypothetical protein